MYRHASGSSKAPGTSVSMMFSSLTPLSMSAFLAPSIRLSMISGCQRARIMPTLTSEPSSSGKETPPAMDGEMARRAAGVDGTADGRWKPRAQLSAQARSEVEELGIVSYSRVVGRFSAIARHTGVVCK